MYSSIPQMLAIAVMNSSKSRELQVSVYSFNPPKAGIQSALSTILINFICFSNKSENQ